MTAPVNRGAVTVTGAAAYLAVSPRTVRHLIAAGHLAAFVPLGMKRNRRILVSELDRYLTESASAA